MLLVVARLLSIPIQLECYVWEIMTKAHSGPRYIVHIHKVLFLHVCSRVLIQRSSNCWHVEGQSSFFSFTTPGYWTSLLSLVYTVLNNALWHILLYKIIPPNSGSLEWIVSKNSVIPEWQLLAVSFCYYLCVFCLHQMHSWYLQSQKSVSNPLELEFWGSQTQVLL